MLIPDGQQVKYRPEAVTPRSSQSKKHQALVRKNNRKTSDLVGRQIISEPFATSISYLLKSSSRLNQMADNNHAQDGNPAGKVVRRLSNKVRRLSDTVRGSVRMIARAQADHKQFAESFGKRLVPSNDQNLVLWTFNTIHDGDKPVLIDADDPRRALSKNAAQKLVQSLTGAFAPGSTVCMHLANDITYPVVTLAILASGAIWTGTNPAYKAMEMEHHFRTSLAKYVITAEDNLEVVSNAVAATGMDIEIILFDNLLDLHAESATYHPRTLRRLKDLLHEKSARKYARAVAGVGTDAMAALMQTSGTTGNPKLAVRTHRAMVGELNAMQDNDDAKPYEVRRLFCAPMFHGFSAPLMLFDGLCHGQTSYYMKRFAHDNFAQNVEKFGITETFGAPPMLHTLAQHRQNHHLLQSLRMVGYGGAVLVPEVRQSFMAIFESGVRLMPVYGMTEGGWYTMLKFPEACNDGSVGRPLPGMEFGIGPAETDQQSPEGPLIGELLVRGPQLMQGYFGNPSASAEAYHKDWFRTGDLGYLQDGKVFILDRLKDLIKTNGWQVAPAELENALLQSPDVADCAVFGYGKGDDEHPVACIVATTSNVTSAAIMEHLTRSMANYKVRRCQIKFVDSIPKSAAGKILRKVLRDQMEEEN